MSSSMETTSSEKQLIVVVEGTASMGPYWKTTISDYLEKIIRSFCASKIPGQKLSDGCRAELGLVVFNVHGPYTSCIVQPSGWTKDIDLFLQYLTTLPMSGGGFSEGAVAEGLAEALMMFSQQPDCHKHCILVAASNPYPLPTPVSKLLIQNVENYDKYEVQIETCLSDAETVAKSFSKSLFSLSVISPKKLPKLQAIYYAGKRNPQAADPVVDNVKNPHFLVLLSESFVEACIALACPAVVNLQPSQSLVKMDGSLGTTAPNVPSVSVSPQTLSTGNGAISNRKVVSVGNTTAATVKNMNSQNGEPSLPASPGFSQTPPILNSTTQGGLIPSASSPSSPSPASQEFKPIVNPLPQALHPVGPAANSNILNNLSQLSQTRQVLSSASMAGGTSIGLQTMAITSTVMQMPNIISNGMASNALSGLNSVSRSGAVATTAQATQNTVMGTSTSTNSNISPNSNLSVSSPLPSLQDNVGMSQSLPNIGQANINSGASGISQQAQQGLNSLAVTNGSTMNKPLNSQQPQPKYDKIWEGSLFAQKQGQTVFICNLEGYRSSMSSEKLAEDWTPSIQILRLIPQDVMNNKEYAGKADFLVFRPLNQHVFLNQLQDKKLCAVINLPHQTLFLSVTDKTTRLIGMLLNGHFPQQQQIQPVQSQQQQQPQRPQMVGAAEAAAPMNQSFVQGASGRSQIMTQGMMQQQQSQSNKPPPHRGNFVS